MFSKYIRQCGLITILTLAVTITLYFMSGDIANFLNSHHYVEDSNTTFLNSDGELDIFLSIALPILAGCGSLLITLITTLQSESVTGLHFCNLQNKAPSKKQLNTTAQNVLTLLKAQKLLIILFTALPTLSCLPYTPLFHMETSLTFVCGFIVILGHSCVTKKYHSFLLSNTNNKEFEKEIVKEIQHCFLEFENDELYYGTKKEEGSAIATKRVAILSDEKFIKA